jgi:deazaflavin-dependent oxidoreductase (nitroreductase family)
MSVPGPSPQPPDAPAGTGAAPQRRPLGRWLISRNPWVVPAITSVHRWLYQKLGGRLVARAGRTQILLLTTTGRRSGQPRVTPLLYVEDGADFVVVASNGGTERVPGWWWNLQENPSAHIQCGRDHHDVRARRATPEETRRLWSKLTEAYEFFDDYQARTARTIPVVILECLS